MQSHVWNVIHTYKECMFYLFTQPPQTWEPNAMYWLYKGKQAPALKRFTNQKAGKKNYKSTTKAYIVDTEVREQCKFNPWVGKIPFRRDGNPFQYSCLENPMDRIAWWAMVHRVSRSQTQLKWLSIYIHIVLPGKFHEQRSQERYSPWGHKESDMI